MLKDNIRLTACQVAGQYTRCPLNIIGDKLVGDRDTPSPGTLCKVLLLALPVPRSRHKPALIKVFYNPLVSAQQMYPIGGQIVALDLLITEDWARVPERALCIE